MTTDHRLHCGRETTPCADCGSPYGRMIRINDHSDIWVHEDPHYCIIGLKTRLRVARARVVELESFLSAYTDTPQEPTS